MGKKILVVDDDISVRTLLEQTFERDGYTAVLAENAEEALSILEKENIQLMFLDLILPDMNGIDLHRKIRKENPSACIFAMTGYNSIFEMTECSDAGFDDYFIKPFDLTVISEAAKRGFSKIERWKQSDIV
ncbi:response regulator [Candidatus Latescibacterota bacterium]